MPNDQLEPAYETVLLDAFAVFALPQAIAILAREGNLTQDGAAESAYALAAAAMRARAKHLAGD